MMRVGDEDVSVQGDNICDERNNRLFAGTMAESVNQYFQEKVLQKRG